MFYLPSLYYEISKYQPSYANPPYRHPKDWTSWYDVLEKKALHYWPISKLDQFWHDLEDFAPNSLDEFYYKANCPEIRDCIVKYICWYYNTEPNEVDGHSFHQEKSINRDYIEEDPSHYFWGIQSIRNYCKNTQNAKKQVKLCYETLQLIKTIFKRNQIKQNH